MIPRTYPQNADGKLVAFEVSATGRTAWIDYIPVQEVTDVSGKENRYDNDGHIPVEMLSSSTGKIAWVDYVPVVVVTGRSDRWMVEADGFIPVVGSGEVVQAFSFDSDAFDSTSFDTTSFSLG